MSQTVTVTATGDSLITRRLPAYTDEGFRRMTGLIQSCDVAFTNMEMVLSDFQGRPVVESGGMNLSAEIGVARDLQRLGFNLTAFANNHTLNYGIEGCLATLDALRALEFVCAGAGRTLAEARLPVFLETPAARVGLVGCASSFAKGQQAGAQRDDAPGRPGLNPQRYQTLYVVDEEHLAAIKRIAERTGAEKMRQFGYWMGFRKPPEREGQFDFAERSFIAGPEFGIRSEAHKGDLAGNVRAVGQAHEQDELTLVSIHAHEQGNERWIPADFIVEFAHACVDAGADMVIGHGPHLLRGLEIYQGKPIFYSVGNFIFEYEYLDRLPADDYESLSADRDLTAPEVFRQISADGTRSFPADRRYWETVLPLVSFRERQLESIELHPLSLGFGAPWPQRGIPRPADERTGSEILAWMQELSTPFGTTIRVDKGVGKVSV
ncbi:MAG TPA: CapA family protein [Thermomicrobiaceae bacterium]|nr:CapA family protein [Thermomicrobiaceae bacterium]